MHAESPNLGHDAEAPNEKVPRLSVKKAHLHPLKYQPFFFFFFFNSF